jgi:hypothetical protein
MTTAVATAGLTALLSFRLLSRAPTTPRDRIPG